jgi:hypothetical protein
MDKTSQISKSGSLISGGIAGCIARTFTSPLEVIKTLKQTTDCSSKSFSQCFKNIYETEGIRGYFRGNGTYLVRTLPYSAIQFLTFEQTNNYLANNNINKNIRYLISGASAGFTSLTFTYPLEVIRTRLTIQSRQNPEYTGIINAYTKIVQTEGTKGLFKGYTMSCMGFIPYLTINFYIFNYLKDNTNPTGNTLINLANGSAAGTAAISITYPSDLIRRKLQVNKEQNIGIFKTIKNIYKINGIRGFYSGYFTGIAKVTPQSGITFMVYELCKRYIIENKVI